MTDVSQYGKIRQESSTKLVPFLDTLIFGFGKMMTSYTAAHSGNSSLQKCCIPLNDQAPEEHGSILMGG